MDVPSGSNDVVDDVISRNHVGSIPLVAVKGSQYSKGSSYEDASGTVEVVNPACYWFFDCGDYWKESLCEKVLGDNDLGSQGYRSKTFWYAIDLKA